MTSENGVPASGMWACAAGILLVGVLMLALMAAPAAMAACPNEQLRQQQGASYLPDCMAFEMVTPPAKAGQPAVNPALSASGERVLFASKAALGGTPGVVSPFGDHYIAARDGSGWNTTSTTPPPEYGVSGGGAPQALTPEFDSWLELSFTEGQLLKGSFGFFQGGIGGSWFEKMTPRPPLNMGSFPGSQLSVNIATARLGGVSVDHSHLVFTPGLESAYYLPGDPAPNGVEQQPNAYMVGTDSNGEQSLSLLARDEVGKVWGGNCGAWLGGGWVTAGARGGLNQGAISPDGSIAYLSTRPEQPYDSGAGEGPPCDPVNPIRILRREEAGTGVEVSEIAPGGPAAGSDFFQAASRDSSKVFFTSSRNLVASDTDPSSEECSGTIGGSKGCDLYLYDAALPLGERLAQVSRGGPGDPTPGEGADVLSGITSVSVDGSHAYFVAQGILTTDPNPEGAVAQDGELNLYAYRRTAGDPDGLVAFVGALDKSCAEAGLSSDCNSLFGKYGNALNSWERSFGNNATAVPMKGEGAAGGDGHVLVFESMAALTADDQDGLHLDVFRYDADANPPTLTCASCTAGAEPINVGVKAGGGPGYSQFAETNAPSGSGARWASEDGSSIVFATREPLVATDVDGRKSPYLWKQGVGLTHLPGLLPQEFFTDTSEFPAVTLSADGGEVAFVTKTALLPADGDTVQDVYVARANGGFPEPPTSPPCSGDACQGPPTTSSAATQAGSERFGGRGAVRPARPCGKGRTRKQGKCVKKKVPKKHKKSNRKRAGHGRGGQK